MFEANTLVWAAVVIYPIMYNYPHIRRYFPLCGTLICTASLLGASSTTKVFFLYLVFDIYVHSNKASVLVALQGGLFAVGGCEWQIEDVVTTF